MADLNGFDANQVEPRGDFEPIPEGKYLAVITDSEMKPTKARNGHFLELTFQIQEGEQNSNALWDAYSADVGLFT